MKATTRARRIRAMFRLEFTYMKWFLLIALLFSVIFLHALNLNYERYLDQFWNNADIEYLGVVAYSNLLYNDMTQFGFTLIVVTGAMALLQQGIAASRRHAQQTASMPATRGETLAAQLLMGFSCALIPVLLAFFGAAIIHFLHRDALNLWVQAMPFADQIRAQDHIAYLLIPLLRVYLLATSIYLVVLFCGHLFSHIAASVLFLACLFALGAIYHNTAIILAGSLQDLGVQWAAKIPLSAIQTSFENLAQPMRMIFISHGIPVEKPWHLLHQFMSVHLPVQALCLAGCALARHKVHIERLGTPFPFRLSRAVAILCLTAWPLLLPIASMTRFDVEKNHYTLNPYLPLLILPAVIVFLAAWYFLIRRPKRAACAALAALLLAAPILCAPNAGAEGEKPTENLVRAQYRAEGFALDMEKAQQALDLFAAIRALDNEFGLWTNSDDDWWGWVTETIPFPECIDVTQKVMKTYSAGRYPAYDEYLDFQELFKLDALDIEVPSDDPIVRGSHQMLAELGYSVLAERLKQSADAKNDAQWQDVERGLHLSYSKEDNRIRLLLSLDAPLFLAEYSELHEIFKEAERFTLKQVYDNGECGLISYEYAETVLGESSEIHLISKLFFLLPSSPEKDVEVLLTLNPIHQKETFTQMIKSMEAALTGSLGADRDTLLNVRGEILEYLSGTRRTNTGVHETASWRAEVRSNDIRIRISLPR